MEDVALMRRVVGPTMGVKAAGGIRAAKDAIRQNLAIPLRAAGFDDAKVVVQFDGEKTAS